MSNNVIEIENLTKDYGNGRGIFNENLTIKQGEMVGFVGTNGSGKTTTIRNILGFIKPTSGSVKVNGLSSWEHASEIAKSVGYVPGEIAFPDLPTGIAFLKCQAEFYGLKDMSYANELIEKLQLDPRANLKRMSKGMKQKTALVAALMNDSPIIILDEPTTGLDPLMRVTFLDIIKKEHEKGKTIFMSSHLFEELETTCDRVALINDGHIIDIADMNEIRHRPVKDMKIEFTNKADYDKFVGAGYEITRLQEQYNQATIRIKNEDTGKLLGALKGYDVKFISELPYTLEKHFKNILIEKKENENNER
jgi:ABC-2 type transport system ATP-binding protein